MCCAVSVVFDVPHATAFGWESGKASSCSSVSSSQIVRHLWWRNQGASIWKMRHCSHVCASEILFEILFALGGAAGLLLRVGAGCRGCNLPRRQPALQLCHGVLVAAHLQAGTRTSGSEPLWNKNRRSTHGFVHAARPLHQQCAGTGTMAQQAQYGFSNDIAYVYAQSLSTCDGWRGW